MTLPIPLLDRPSAVGEEGRPRARSLAVASFVAAAVVTVVGVYIGQPDLVVTLGTVAGLAAAGMSLLDRERFVHLLAGYCLLAWFGWPLSLLVVGAGFYSRGGLAASGLAVALFGLAATWGDAADREGLRRTVFATGMTYIGVWVWLLGFTLVATVLGIAFLVLTGVGAASGIVSATLGFLFVLVAAAGGVLLGLRWLPVRQMTPRSRRPTVEAWLAGIRRLTLGTIAASVAVGVLAVVFWTLHAFGYVGSLPLAASRPVVALTSPWVLGPVVALGGGCFLAGVVALAIRWLTGQIDPTSSRRVAALVAAFPLGVLAVVALLLLFAVPLVGFPLLLVVLLAPLALVAAALVVFVAAKLDVVPDRAGGPALSASGFIVAAIALADAAILAFLCVAAALLVWDVSTFGLGVTAELGHRPDTRRLELLHGLLSVGIAVAVVALAVAVDTARTAAFADIGGAVPALIVGIGALLIVAALRG